MRAHHLTYWRNEMNEIKWRSLENYTIWTWVCAPTEMIWFSILFLLSHRRGRGQSKQSQAVVHAIVYVPLRLALAHAIRQHVYFHVPCSVYRYTHINPTMISKLYKFFYICLSNNSIDLYTGMLHLGMNKLHELKTVAQLCLLAHNTSRTREKKAALAVFSFAQCQVISSLGLNMWVIVCWRIFYVCSEHSLLSSM